MPTPLNGSYNFLLAILAGLRAADPAADVNTYLNPKGEALVDQVGRTCDGPAVDPGIAFGSLLSRPLGAGLGRVQPGVRSIGRECCDRHHLDAKVRLHAPRPPRPARRQSRRSRVRRRLA